MTHAAVEARGLSLGYPGDGGLVLADVSLRVAPTEFVCVVGPSGCGKSSLLNVLAGFLPPTRGEVLVGGAPVVGPDPRRLFIFQEGGLFPWLTVEGNVGLGLRGRPAEERDRRVNETLALVGLAGQGQRFPAQLSGGMKQRVELARALAADPDVLFMDEPFGALDFLTRLKMRLDLTQIWERAKKTIVLITHDVDESVQLADRVLVLNGRPARVVREIPVNLPRPRAISDPAYLALRDEVLAAIGLDSTGAAR